MKKLLLILLMLTSIPVFSQKLTPGERVSDASIYEHSFIYRKKITNPEYKSGYDLGKANVLSIIAGYQKIDLTRTDVVGPKDRPMTLIICGYYENDWNDMVRRANEEEALAKRNYEQSKTAYSEGYYDGIRYSNPELLNN